MQLSSSCFNNLVSIKALDTMLTKIPIGIPSVIFKLQITMTQ